MDQFEYLSVLVSIILGLGMTHILVGVGRLLRRRRQVESYWVHSLQTATMFLFLINQWWTTFSWAEFPNLSFFHHVFLMTTPVCLFLGSVLLFPDEDIADVSLRDHYFQVHRPYYLLFAAVFPLDVVDTGLKGLDRFAALGVAYWPMMLVGFGLAMLAASVRNPRYHAVAQPAFAVWLLITVLLWKTDLAVLLSL